MRCGTEGSDHLFELQDDEHVAAAAVGVHVGGGGGPGPRPLLHQLLHLGGWSTVEHTWVSISVLA